MAIERLLDVITACDTSHHNSAIQNSYVISRCFTKMQAMAQQVNNLVTQAQSIVDQGDKLLNEGNGWANIVNRSRDLPTPPPQRTDPEIVDRSVFIGDPSSRRGRRVKFPVMTHQQASIYRMPVMYVCDEEIRGKTYTYLCMVFGTHIIKIPTDFRMRARNDTSTQMHREPWNPTLSNPPMNYYVTPEVARVIQSVEPSAYLSLNHSSPFESGNSVVETLGDPRSIPPNSDSWFKDRMYYERLQYAVAMIMSAYVATAPLAPEDT
jgi:hypothetical protein